MTGEVRPLHLVPDTERHGVAVHARDLAEACGCAVSAGAPGPDERVHVHFTERLWGQDPETAAARVSEIGRRHPMTVTLHDLPQTSDGPSSHTRRAAAYAQVLAASRAVVCNSHWEAGLLAALPGSSAVATIIPLAVKPLSAPRPDAIVPAPSPVIGLLGYVYPGKGHSEAIDAAAAASEVFGRRVRVVALGAVSDGHAADVHALGERAERQGVTFSVTGYLPDAELVRCARQITVPLAAHQHVSASGSIGNWLTAGRRPLVVDSAYAREIDALRPGTIRRYTAADLTATVLETLADPLGGWLASGTDLRPGLSETADAYRRFWNAGVAW